MNRYQQLFISVALLLMTTLAAGAEQVPVAVSDRALHFVLNLYTGASMRAQEWLVPESQASAGLKDYGGLAAVVRQSTAFAHQYGGVSSVRIESLSVTGDIHRVAVHVSFPDDARRRADPVTSEREDVVWRLAAKQLKGEWRFAVE